MKGWMFFFFFVSIKLAAQDCSVTLKGIVKELSTEHAMENVFVTVEETKQKVATNEKGEFLFINMCPGEYHVSASHLGCETCTVFCMADSNETVDIKLKHFTELLNETIVYGKETKSLQTSSTITSEDLKENANKSFGDILSDIEGVSSIKVGNNISKPIVHGLVGNRVGFIDGGIPLASQQWGVDHAPEIDASKADHISVLKGVAALEYATTSNAIVIVEPVEIKKDPNLHGTTNYIYDTNSRGHTANLSLTNYNKIIGFHITGTIKKSGDARAPGYFLTNTGAEQQSFSAVLEKEIGSKLKITGNYSYFNNKLGILSGALLETPAELERALSAEVPARTNDSFSYDFSQPNQEVTHHFVEFEADYKFSNVSKLKLEYAYQLNERKEFDRRRGAERTERPELDLNLNSHYFSSVFKTKFSGSDSFKIGAQYTLTENKNIFGTGTFPLVPDYSSDEIGLFSFYTNRKGKWGYEFGGRLNLSSFNVATAIRVVERFNYDYTNFSLGSGVSYQFNKNLKSTLNVGYSTRGAKTNELFSFGVHQGVASFERGSFFSEEEGFLDDERSFKTTWSWDYSLNDNFFIEALFYANPIQDYIYLEPDNNINIDERGTLPSFTYRQTDAVLLGQDFRVVYNPVDRLKFTLKYAYLYGQDVSADIPLINTSPNNVSLNTSLTLNDKKYLKNTIIGLSVSHTAKQDRFNIEQEIAAPPDAFTLLNFNANTNIIVGKQKFELGLKVENLTNTTYRNYLNRLRYFADERGINLSFRLGYKF